MLPRREGPRQKGAGHTQTIQELVHNNDSLLYI